MSKQTVDGFYFEDAARAAQAEKEAQTISYIRSKTNLSNAGAVHAIYKKLIENNVFSTEVGYAFLAELYRILQASGMYNDSELPRIYISKGRVARDEQLSGTAQSQTADGQNADEEVLSEEDEARIIEAVRKRTKSLNDTSKTQVRNIRAMYRDKLKTYKLVIGTLVLCIVGMLAMIYFSDGSPLRDAEQQVLDKYATWQESLQEQEAELQKKQAALAAWEKELEEQSEQMSGQ